mmetsp:Transcript_8819/g.22228  ORF Transcript_8819/g.22228 Transcript_8819/m.22228 type:complete len:223 (-) Transcript_8819:115-783(-)
MTAPEVVPSATNRLWTRVQTLEKELQQKEDESVVLKRLLEMHQDLPKERAKWEDIHPSPRPCAVAVAPARKFRDATVNTESTGISATDTQADLLQMQMEQTSQKQAEIEAALGELDLSAVQAKQRKRFEEQAQLKAMDSQVERIEAAMQALLQAVPQHDASRETRTQSPAPRTVQAPKRSRRRRTVGGSASGQDQEARDARAAEFLGEVKKDQQWGLTGWLW